MKRVLFTIQFVILLLSVPLLMLVELQSDNNSDGGSPAKAKSEPVSKRPVVDEGPALELLRQ